MFDLMSELIDFSNPKLSMREIIKNSGFMEIYGDSSENWDFVLEEFHFTPGSLLVLGYDKDLDHNIFEQVSDYEEKEEDDDFTVFEMPIDDVLDKLNNSSHSLVQMVQVPNTKIYLPSVDQNTEYLVLPIDRVALPKRGSSPFPDYKAIIPAELASIFYFNDTDEAKVLNYYLESLADAFSDFPTLDDDDFDDLQVWPDEQVLDLDFGGILTPVPKEIPDGSLSGLVTVPFALFTGVDLGTKYISTIDPLFLSVVSEQNYVDDNQNNPFCQNRVNHSLDFIRKYFPLFPKP